VYPSDLKRFPKQVRRLNTGNHRQTWKRGLGLVRVGSLSDALLSMVKDGLVHCLGVVWGRSDRDPIEWNDRNGGKTCGLSGTLRTGDLRG
jgi:hypothetical protein